MKIPLDYEFGDPVIVMLRTTVQNQTEIDGVIEVITDDGVYSSDDVNLIGVFPDVTD